MWVGGDRRGVVLSANYPARNWGVRGGMSSATARRLCPTAIALPADFDAYTEVSCGIVEILRTFSARVDSASIDEAYLELSPGTAWQSAVRIGEEIRALVQDEQLITCSVGIASNRLIAKMGSVAAKPDGLMAIRADQVQDFLSPLPVERLVGVGPSVAARLHRLGIFTVAELAAAAPSALRRVFGANSGHRLLELSRGIDLKVAAGQGERGVGAQETFAQDTGDAETVSAELLRLALRVTRRMRLSGVVGTALTVHLRRPDFTVNSRAQRLRAPTDLTEDVHEAARRLYRRLNPDARPVRRIGIRVHGLARADQVPIQPRLGDPDHGWREAELATDELRRRFGSGAVRRAALTRRHRP